MQVCKSVLWHALLAVALLIPLTLAACVARLQVSQDVEWMHARVYSPSDAGHPHRHAWELHSHAAWGGLTLET